MVNDAHLNLLRLLYKIEKVNVPRFIQCTAYNKFII